MLRLIPAIAVLLFTPTTEQNKGVERLRDVGSVYVADLGQTEGAKTLRQEIIKELVKSGRVRVVDEHEEADAVLSARVRSGSKNVDRAFEVFGEGPGLIVTGSAVVPTQEIMFRLNSRRNRTLWAVKFDTGSFSGQGERQAALALANKLSRELRKALERDSKRRR